MPIDISTIKIRLLEKIDIINNENKNNNNEKYKIVITKIMELLDIFNRYTNTIEEDDKINILLNNINNMTI